MAGRKERVYVVENTSARSPRGVPRKVLVIKSFHAKRPLGRVGMWTDGIRIGHGLHVIAEWRSDLICLEPRKMTGLKGPNSPIKTYGIGRTKR